MAVNIRIYDLYVTDVVVVQIICFKNELVLKRSRRVKWIPLKLPNELVYYLNVIYKVTKGSFNLCSILH